MQDLDPSLDDGWDGLLSFLHVRVKNPAGNVIIDRDLDWCPVGWEIQRVDDSGPDVPRMPFDGCYAMPFALGTVMGLDQGWAAPVSSRYGSSDPVLLDGRDGAYRVTLLLPADRDRYVRVRSRSTPTANVTVTWRPVVTAPSARAGERRRRRRNRPLGCRPTPTPIPRPSPT